VITQASKKFSRNNKQTLDIYFIVSNKYISQTKQLSCYFLFLFAFAPFKAPDLAPLIIFLNCPAALDLFRLLIADLCKGRYAYGSGFPFFLTSPLAFLLLYSVPGALLTPLRTDDALVDLYKTCFTQSTELQSNHFLPVYPNTSSFIFKWRLTNRTDSTLHASSSFPFSVAQN
jgi:hypothetical protein